MNDMKWVGLSLKARFLNSTLSVFLTAFGVMLALIILQFGHHVQNRLSADGQNIDIVVGAKGSPIQLILSSIYHADIPTGNIPYEDFVQLKRHPHIKTAIPLALGDNWRGYRIVGTHETYLKHYQAEMAAGQVWTKPFEAVAGASVPLKVKDTFLGAHGLDVSGHVHDEEKYQIVGKLKPTGTVLDRLILTSLDSVLLLHGVDGVEGHHDHEEHGHEDEHTHHDHEEHGYEGEHAHHDHEGHGHEDEHAHADHEDEHAHHDHEAYGHEDEHTDHDAHSNTAAEAEITAILLETKTPLANMNLPRKIQRETNLQAANPALEMARLSQIMGLGAKSFTMLSILIIVIASLSIFTGLAGSFQNRMGDFAVLRAMGYSQGRIFKMIALEGLVITILGLIIGMVFGYLGFNLMVETIAALAHSGAAFTITIDMAWVALCVLLAGLLASVLPAYRAAKVDIAHQLSRHI